jgi:hypothetical protein
VPPAPPAAINQGVIQMPRPPILPVLDWSAIFASGQEFAAWLAAAADPERARRLADGLAALTLAPHEAALLAALPRPVHVVAIAEDWCGDVVRHAPVLERLARAGANLRVRYVSREQHPDAFARFLTNGGEAIPKFVFLNDRFVECGHWGPMPDACRRLIAQGKACGDGATARQLVSARYAADPGCRDVVRELLDLVQLAATVSL